MRDSALEEELLDPQIILFGSYARDDWIDEEANRYLTDRLIKLDAALDIAEFCANRGMFVSNIHQRGSARSSASFGAPEDYGADEVLLMNDCGHHLRSSVL